MRFEDPASMGPPHDLLSRGRSCAREPCQHPVLHRPATTVRSEHSCTPASLHTRHAFWPELEYGK